MNAKNETTLTAEPSIYQDSHRTKLHKSIRNSYKSCWLTVSRLAKESQGCLPPFLLTWFHGSEGAGKLSGAISSHP